MIERTTVLYTAVLYNFVIIGEGARSNPEGIREQHAETGWAGIRAMRNAVTHVCFGVNPTRVHQTIRDDLPPTFAPLRAIPKPQ